MASPQRILVLATATGGGDWPPLAAVTVGLHQAGHAVQCFGDPTIAQAFASTAIAVAVVPAEDILDAFFARWRAAGVSGPAPLRAWADACVPAVRALVLDFAPCVVLSQLYTMELARLVKAACGLRWCCINSTYYFGPGSTRPFEADFTGPARERIPQFLAAMAEADLVLHGTDPLFDPPPPSFPRHHQHVGFLMWEPSSAGPTYLDVPGAPWVLVTLSSGPHPQEGETALARTALQTLAESPVRVVVTLTAGHPRDELGAVPANARIEGFVPHSAVLKHSCLLVSHAGHGVVAKALSSGVPMVLVPWGRDQPGVAARAAALGVAEVIPRHDLTEQRLAVAIQRVLGTPRYREHAARIASHLQAQDAVAIARARIEALLETP
jgi:UDP:flavonoid glycosyltransferase YjiC (YdhE family)